MINTGKPPGSQVCFIGSAGDCTAHHEVYMRTCRCLPVRHALFKEAQPMLAVHPIWCCAGVQPYGLSASAADWQPRYEVWLMVRPGVTVEVCSITKRCNTAAMHINLASCFRSHMAGRLHDVNICALSCGPIVQKPLKTCSQYIWDRGTCEPHEVPTHTVGGITLGS